MRRRGSSSHPSLPAAMGGAQPTRTNYTSHTLRRTWACAQHRMARQGQKGKGKRHRPLSRQMERRLAKHAKSHSAEHIQKMKADIQSGMTFKRAHSRAMASTIERVIHMYHYSDKGIVLFPDLQA
eukprot:COSAG02_NODE_6357_length_3627_cov_11.172052_7_plen_125_part_00